MSHVDANTPKACECFRCKRKCKQQPWFFAI